jgi:hypothetical protein
MRIFPCTSKKNYGEGIYELEDLDGEKALGSNLPPKLGLTKRTLLASFPNRSLIKHLSQTHVSLCPIAPP